MTNQNEQELNEKLGLSKLGLEAKVLEDNGKVQRIALIGVSNDSGKAWRQIEGCYMCYLYGKETISKPTLIDHFASISIARGKTSSTSIDSVIDSILGKYKKSLRDYKQFKSELEEKKVLSYDFIDALFEYKVEGYGEGENYRYISPRFIRPVPKIYGHHQFEGEKSKNGIAIELAIDSAKKLWENQMEYSNWVASVSVMIQNAFGADKEFDFNRFNDDVEYRNQVKEEFRERAYPLVCEKGGKTNELQRRFISDFLHYDQFLERCNSDLDVFIQTIESYK